MPELKGPCLRVDNGVIVVLRIKNNKACCRHLIPVQQAFSLNKDALYL